MNEPTEQVDCPNCNGTGNEPEVFDATGGPVPCDMCDGAGWIFHGEDETDNEPQNAAEWEAP